MKKVLSLLTAFGLIATTGSTAVACTKKVETTFKDLSSINALTWKVNEFGRFVAKDFETKVDPNRVEIKNQEKLISYIAAGFTNYQETYQKLINMAISPTIYQLNPKTEQYVAVEAVEKIWNGNDNFVQITVSTSLKNKTSFLPLKVSDPEKQQDLEEVFDLQTWLTNGGHPDPILIDAEWKKNNPVLRDLSLKIIQDHQYLLANPSPWNADEPISDMFNFVGEYMLEKENFVSAYSPDSAPISIKQQLNRYYRQIAVEWKQKVRLALIDEWKKIDPNQDLLNWSFEYSQGQNPAKLIFDFRK